MEKPKSQAADLESQSNSNQEGKTPSPFAAALQRQHPDWVAHELAALGETTIIVPREYIVAACQFVVSARRRMRGREKARVRRWA